MGKHRHKQHYRRTVVAAVAMGVIGVPSVAMACAEWPDAGRQNQEAAPAAATAWWNDADWYRQWSGHEEPATSAPAQTPAPSASTTAASASPAQKKWHAQHGAPRSHKPAHKPSHKPQATAAETEAATTAAPRPAASSPAPKPTTSAPTTSAPSTPQATATASGAVAQVVQLVNAERAKAGCQAVTVNADLTKAAQAHSEDMASHGTMSHDGSDGSSPADRITGAGYSWSAYGENVAYGYASPEEVMAGWMASPGHRENILNCSFKEIGVGLAQPNAYWTQDFGTAR